MDKVAQELKVIDDFYDLLIWMTRHTEKFPRHHRYSLGIAIENRLQVILAHLLRAKYTKRKVRWLTEANVELEVLRFQVRLARDLKALPASSHAFAAKSLLGVGAQVGGWLKSLGMLRETIRRIVGAAYELRNLLLAAHKAQRGKRHRHAVQAFSHDLERKLLEIQQLLVEVAWRPGGFHSHWITRPKARLISAAPYADRVVHHALMNVLEPILDRHFHGDSYACRRGKGTHAAADRMQALMRRHAFALQCDVRKFFPSIDHEILKCRFRRLIKDARVLELMDRIVDSSNPQEPVTAWFEGDDLFTPAERRRGLPIGNLTSQWFANWMLDDLDHFVTSGLRLGAYVRYCDDFIVLHDDRQRLRDAAERINAFLGERRLRLHETNLAVRPVRAGLNFVGYRIWASHRLLRKQRVRDFRRRVRWMRGAYRQRLIGWDDIKPRLDSWLGHARRANSERLVRRVSRDWVFPAGRRRKRRVCCGAVRGTTNRATAGRPTATRTRRASGTTTSGSVSACTFACLIRHDARNVRRSRARTARRRKSWRCPGAAGPERRRPNLRRAAGRDR